MARILISLCDHSGTWSRPFIDKGWRVIRVDPKHGGRDHGGLGYTAGNWDSGACVGMPDGGYGVGMTAGAFADSLRDYGVGNTLRRILPHVDSFDVIAVMAAPPCTDFTNSGSQHWKAKDADGRTEQSVTIIRDCLRVVQGVNADWWVLENPVGRLKRLVPELGQWSLRFHPHEFAGWADDPATDAYTKNTCLWGTFNPELERRNVEPVMIERKRRDGSIVRGSWQWANLGGKSERTKELRSITPTGFARAFAEANG